MLTLLVHTTLFFCITTHMFSFSMYLDMDCINTIVSYSQNAQCTCYIMGKSTGEIYQLPSTLSPTLLKTYWIHGPTQDLSNPEPHSDIYPSTQVWLSKKAEEGIRLTQGTNRTCATLFLHNTKQNEKYSRNQFIFDGVNTDNTVIFSKQKGDYHELFACTLPQEQRTCTTHKSVTPIYNGFGNIASLMLENNRNRLVYTINHGPTSSHKLLYITDLVASDSSCYTQCSNVARLSTEHLFIKTVYLGKDTYFGITSTGLLYAFWLTKIKTIKLALQKCSYFFKDVAVDTSCITDNGFHQKIAFLTTTGEIHIAYLSTCDKPTLFYVATIEKPDQALRLFYNNGKLIIMYNFHNRTVYELNDNVDSVYGYYLLKKLYRQAYTK